MLRNLLLVVLATLTLNTTVQAQEHSIARQWNDLLLEAIRDDFARPTVHARNLFHISTVMYDAWAILEQQGNETYMLGKTLNTYECAFEDIVAPANLLAAQEEAISYAVFRMIEHRFALSPGAAAIITRCTNLMEELNYDVSFTSTDYSNGSYAALGNYIASCMITYGQQDGSNEDNEYANEFYTPSNPSLIVDGNGNPNIVNPNVWQPLTLETFIDQSGNPIPINTPAFLSPEWGSVLPFSLEETDKTTYEKDGDIYSVYFDPGRPPYVTDSMTRDYYIWNFSMVSIWASHLDTTDGVMWDISPASIGNNPPLPTTEEGMRNFYNYLEGGDQSRGWDVNPSTGQPYAPQMVPRGDYGRVLAEFWADGPDSETPPGHWFTILNYVNDHPETIKKFNGQGEILSDLEWDVKSYFIMGGTVHDAAIAAWGIKGWYDYIRPISAIRYMAEQGQSTDTSIGNYHPNGLPLIDGLIETVQIGDPLSGINFVNVGKIKLYTWKGPDYIDEPETDQAGVGWILAEDWWPYQRPSFVTPPFAGYVSGHSTYSRAAAEAMTLLTGDAYFPGGMGEFEAPMNEFLVFEEGPSMNIKLQWATYRDASDQCSLSRIWGGIHPPVDDIPGRLIGEQLGINAFNFASGFFNNVTAVNNIQVKSLEVFPNVLANGMTLNVKLPNQILAADIDIMNMNGQLVKTARVSNNAIEKLNVDALASGMYVVRLTASNGSVYQNNIVVQ